MINCGIANALIIVGAAVYRYMLGFNSASDMKIISCNCPVSSSATSAMSCPSVI